MVTNPSFETSSNGHPTSWTSLPTNRLNVYTGFQQCGSAIYAATDSWDGTDVSIFQQINSISAGTQFRLQFYGGTHVPTGSHYFGVRFYNSGGTILSTQVSEVDFDVDLNPAGSLGVYNIIATAPPATSYLRLIGFSDVDYLKLDQVCLTTCPTINTAISGSTSICTGSSSTLTASGSGGSAPYTYLWSTGATTAAITTSTAGTYNVTTTSSTGCTGTKSVTVTVNALPNVSAGADKELTCTTTFVQMGGSSSTSGVSYVWVASNGGNITSGGNTSTPIVNSSGTYTLTVTTTATGCTATDIAIVTSNTSIPNVSVGPDVSICNGSNLTLTAIGNGTFIWNNNETTASIVVNPSQTTTYQVVLTAANGCIASDEIVVTVNEKISIGDFVWLDNNFNGVQNELEDGINGIIVQLYNTSDQLLETTTTVNKIVEPGYYNFEVCAGTYYIKFGESETMVRTNKYSGSDNSKDSDANVVTGKTDNFTVTYGASNFTIDAGYAELASIGNYVWEDLDRDGMQESGEPAISGVSVVLSGINGYGQNVTQTTLTNNFGQYSFSNLVPGTYIVSFTKPQNYFATEVDKVTDDTVDSDADTTTGSAPFETLVSGENNTTIDAGYYRCAVVGNYIWNDNLISNDVQDITEEGINGVDVHIYLSSNLSTPLYSTTTGINPLNSNLNGYYSFELCQVDEYVIKVDKPSDMIFVSANMSGSDEEDSDIVDFYNQMTNPFYVSYAVLDQSIDIGLRSAPLPVKLLNFDARWNESSKKIIIAWETLNEINVDKFILERSIDNINFQVIETVEANGSFGNGSTYKAYDDDIPYSGVYFFRLTTVDIDKKMETTKAVQVEISLENGDFDYSIYPNPSESFVNLVINSIQESKISVEIYNKDGKLMHKIKDKVGSNQSKHSFDTSNWAKGIYLVNITVDNITKVQKIVII